MLLHRSGSGSPAVVVLPGGGTVGLDYLNVQERGGFYACHYAHRFPGEVAGLVLLDPAHEDYDAYMPRELVEIWHAWDPDQALPAEVPDELIQFYRGLFAAEMADWPTEFRELLIDRHVSPEWFGVGLAEAKNLGQLNDELRRTGKMPDVPLIILTAMGIDPFKQAVSGGTPESLLREEIDGKRRLYTALAASVSQGENRLIDDVGHVTLHLRRPDAVQQAIQDLLGWARQLIAAGWPGAAGRNGAAQRRYPSGVLAV